MKLAFATILVGIGSGIAGMSLALLLRAVQHVAFAYSPGELIGPETFLMGVEAASQERRVWVLILCGFFAGFGWWAIKRLGKPLVSISEAINAEKKMPVLTSISHILLQIITVGLGSPLGREVAPRELGTLLASWLSSKAGLDPKDAKTMLACGAGAGLAAVYNVPLAGAVFVLEVLLQRFSFKLLSQAAVVSSIAVLVSWIGLGNRAAYELPPTSLTLSLIVWSIVAGPILGLCARQFIDLTSRVQKQVVYGPQTAVLSLINFSLLGVAAIYLPALLGNGKSPAQLEFDDAIGLGVTATLLILRVLFTCTSLRAGAYGGLLTPSVAIGALLAVLMGGVWRLLWPGPTLNTFALVGATAFLGSAQKMPVTAIILMFEFTRVSPALLIPFALATLGAQWRVRR